MRKKESPTDKFSVVPSDKKREKGVNTQRRLSGAEKANMSGFSEIYVMASWLSYSTLAQAQALALPLWLSLILRIGITLAFQSMSYIARAKQILIFICRSNIIS